MDEGKSISKPGGKRTRYSGDLNKRFPPASKMVASGKTVEETGHFLRDEVYRKMLLLAKHYGIATNVTDPELFAQLAICLAFAHVPGFQFAAERRSSKLWSDERLKDLLATIKQIKKERGIKGDKQACRVIVKEYPQKWGKPVTTRKELRSWIETVESRLQDAKKKAKIEHQLEMKALVAALLRQ
jgi:hypothetical protein